MKLIAKSGHVRELIASLYGVEDAIEVDEIIERVGKLDTGCGYIEDLIEPSIPILWMLGDDGTITYMCRVHHEKEKEKGEEKDSPEDTHARERRESIEEVLCLADQLATQALRYRPLDQITRALLLEAATFIMHHISDADLKDVGR